MTQDEIIALAHQLDVLDAQHYGTLWVDKLVRFAKGVGRNVRTGEREACANVCESKHANGTRKYTHADECAEAIRARGDE